MLCTEYEQKQTEFQREKILVSNIFEIFRAQGAIWTVGADRAKIPWKRYDPIIMQLRTLLSSAGTMVYQEIINSSANYRF